MTILWNYKKDKPEGCWDGSTTIIEQHSFDTIYPSDYIMTYPGSWWEYDNGKIDSCKNWILQKIETRERNGPCLTVYEDLIYVPKDPIGIIYNGSIIKATADYQGTKFVELIDINKSNTKISWGIGSYPFADGDGYSGSKIYKSEIIESLDSFQIASTMYYDIIHCKMNYRLKHFKYNTPPPTYYEYYFAKNIGLIQYESTFNGTTTIKNIVNHYIAPH